MSFVALKMVHAPLGTVGRWYIAEEVTSDETSITIKDIVCVYDYLLPDTTPNSNRVIPTSRMFADVMYEGSLKFYRKDIEADTPLEPGDSRLAGYNQVIKAFKLTSMNITLGNEKAPREVSRIHGI